MLQIILLILKFIGIVLLALLGLLVTLLLVVLLVPVRYRIWVSHGAMLRLEGRVSWFLHLIHLRITQEGEKRRFRLRLFGFVLFDSDRPRKPGKPKQRRKKAADRTREPGSRDRIKGQEAIRHETTQHEITEPRTAEPRTTVQRADEHKSEETIASDSSSLSEKEATDYRSPLAEAQDNSNSGEETEKTVGVFGRFLRKIKNILKGIRDRFHRILRSIKQVLSKLANIRQKVSLIKEFISEEDNRMAFGVTWQSLKKLLKHVLPKKLSSRVVFGTGDPCSTGQALGALSLLYGIYGEHVRITPDFENKVFEGSHYARGRIRMGTLLIIVIKLLLDKKFKQLKRNFKILKEAL